MNAFMSTLFLCLFAIAAQANTAQLFKHESVMEQEDCFYGIFSSYDKWYDFIREKNAKRAKDEAELEKRMAGFSRMFTPESYARFKATVDCRNFAYLVGAEEVAGYVMMPKSAAESGKKLPVIITNRGGNSSFGATTFAGMLAQRFPLAEAGFVVIGSQYRGSYIPSKSFEHKDEFGGKDVEDVVALMDIVRAIPVADSHRVGMWGASRGVMQSFLALKKMSEVKALVAIAGNTDLMKGLKARPKMEEVYKRLIPNYENDKVEALTKRSAINFIAEINPELPVLLIHGDQDKRVQVERSIELAAKLKALDRPHELVIFEGDNHFLRKNKDAVVQKTIEWFKKYL